jgi:ribosomal protein S17E
MIYNEKIVSEYGANNVFVGNAPIAFKPSPVSKDYVAGYITRWFAKRINETKAIEIDAAQREKINTSLYIDDYSRCRKYNIRWQKWNIS